MNIVDRYVSMWRPPYCRSTRWHAHQSIVDKSESHTRVELQCGGARAIACHGESCEVDALVIAVSCACRVARLHYIQGRQCGAKIASEALHRARMIAALLAAP